MATEVTMPKFGLTMHEGTLQRCFKAAGETVNAGEPLYEVETEKVLYVVESPATGTLAAWLQEEGATVECGGLVAVIAEAGEDVTAVAASHGAGAAAQRAAAPVPVPRPAPSAAPAGAADGAGEAAASAEGRRAVSPVARKLAAELGVDLARVPGSGPGGRVTREDVERAAQKGTSGRAEVRAEAGPGGVAAGAAATPPGPGKPVLRTVPFRGMRRTIATRMHQSLRDTAQLTITSEVDVGAATEMRTRLTRDFDFTYTDMLIQAAARALLRHPRMNSRIVEEAIVVMPEVHIGMAVALEEGLIVPVVRDADRKSLREIAAVTKDLGERARSGKLKIEDVSGGTFTVTNLGTWGVDVFTPILNLGETGILGVGRIVEKPAIYRGEIAKRSMLTLSLTFDHRVIDGAPAAAFLQTVADIFNFGDR
ncbi:MAG TPA: dihydrolipoamide acetyltransferase family protein [Candidatus Binataceae bacterium]|nr:dihydrolipoamide acetyltransferase family protein [Candidatus Binataceae bacterium]